jgi:hypothetical protein
MKKAEISRPKARNAAVKTKASAAPIRAPPSQIGLSLACSPAPTAALVRMPTAIEMPRAAMKVRAAQFIAIWCAARATAPSQPIITVAEANAPLSNSRHPEAGRPTDIIRRSLSRETGANQWRGHALRMAGSMRSQTKIAADPTVREISVDIPDPVRPSAGIPRRP